MQWVWIDDLRPAPEGYVWIKSVHQAQKFIRKCAYMKHMFPNRDYWDIALIDTDHDAGSYAQFGGDYIKLLDWMERNELSFPIRIHSMNPVGVANMRAIIEKNGWTEVR